MFLVVLGNFMSASMYKSLSESCNFVICRLVALKLLYYGLQLFINKCLHFEANPLKADIDTIKIRRDNCTSCHVSFSQAQTIKMMTILFIAVLLVMMSGAVWSLSVWCISYVNRCRTPGTGCMFQLPNPKIPHQSLKLVHPHLVRLGRPVEPQLVMRRKKSWQKSPSSWW